MLKKIKKLLQQDFSEVEDYSNKELKVMYNRAKIGEVYPEQKRQKVIEEYEKIGLGQD